MHDLHQDEVARYTRQMMMDGWGEAGQAKLKGATVFVAGAGGLGSPASIYLAVAGVGRLILCDFDSPDLSNLNRQILHDPTRIGINKAVSGRMTLSAINSRVDIEAVTEKIDAANAERLIDGADIIVDCMDNMPTRFVLNDAAHRLGIPLVHGAIRGMEGRVTFIRPGKTPCLRCLIAEAPPKEVFPVVGATPGVVGSIQALEVLKYLTGIGRTLDGRLLVWDGTDMEFQTFRLQKNPSCPICAGPVGASR